MNMDMDMDGKFHIHGNPAGSCRPSTSHDLLTRMSACIDEVAVWMRSSWTLRRSSFSGPQPAAVFISCRSHRSGSAPTIFHQLLPFETLECTSTVMSPWGLTSRKRCRPATRYCVNCGLSDGQCRDLFFSCWCRLSSSHGWTTAILHSPAFHHISCPCLLYTSDAADE